MTLRTFRNPESEGGRTVHVGDVVIEPGETKQVEMPTVTVWDHSGAEVGSFEQSCPDLLEEVGVAPVNHPPEPEPTVPSEPDRAPEPAED